MIILLFAISVSIFGGLCLWVAGSAHSESLPADSEIPDTVPIEWVDAYWAGKRRLT